MHKLLVLVLILAISLQAEMATGWQSNNKRFKHNANSSPSSSNQGAFNLPDYDSDVSVCGSEGKECIATNATRGTGKVKITNLRYPNPNPR